MSKILTAETKHQQEPSPEPPSDVPPPDAIDAAAAWHIELLSRTDAKLDQFSARLDRVFAEMGRWGQMMQRLEHRSSGPPARSARGPVLRLLLVLGLVVVGAMNAAALRQWAAHRLPALLAEPPSAAVPVPPPVVSSTADRVAFKMRAPAPLRPRLSVPSPTEVLAQEPLIAPPAVPAAPLAAGAQPAVVRPVDGRIHI